MLRRSRVLQLKQDITYSCRRTSKCLTSASKCRGKVLHCTDLCKYSGCENEDNAENEEWNYSDTESD